MTARGLYITYVRGWTIGAAARAHDPGLAEHAEEDVRDAYQTGYRHGCQDRDSAAQVAAARAGYTPSMFRSAPDAGQGGE